MITTAFDTGSLSYESYRFREALRNELLLQPHYSLRPGAWEYKGTWYSTMFDLYIAILAHQAAEEFGIADVLGLIAVLSGQAFISTRGKFKDAEKGTSLVSKYMSKIPGKSPVRLPTIVGTARIIGGEGFKVRFTIIIGKFIGRTVPFVGWGILAYELGSIFYNTQVEFNRITGNE